MDLALTPLEWLAATAVVFSGTVVQGSIGFGVALLSAPLLYLVNPMLVPAPMIVVGMSVPTLVFLRERRHVDAREILRVLPGIATGVAAAAVVLTWVSSGTLELLFGVLVLAAVALSVGMRPPARPGWGTLFIAGGMAGFMSTTTSIGGPPLALVFQNRSGGHLRGTLSACFVPIGLLSLVALYATGHLGTVQVIAGVSLVPAVALGFWVSACTARALDHGWLRWAVLAVSAVAGIVAVVRGLA